MWENALEQLKRLLRIAGDLIVFVGIPVTMIAVMVIIGIRVPRTPDMKGILDTLPPLAGVATALLTYWYVAYTARMVRHMIQAAREESRPYVVADFEYEDHIIYVVVSNLGKTPAADVVIRFTPELEGMCNLSQTIFKDRIRFLPPQRAIKSVVHVSWEFFDEKDERPTEYDVHITYRRVNSRDRYVERYRLDLAWFQHITSVSRKGVHEIADSLDKMQRTFDRVVKWDGVHIKTSADLRREHRERMKRSKVVSKLGRKD